MDTPRPVAPLDVAVMMKPYFRLAPEKLRRAIVSTGLRSELIPTDAEVISPSVPDMPQAHKA